MIWYIIYLYIYTYSSECCSGGQLMNLKLPRSDVQKSFLPF